MRSLLAFLFIFSAIIFSSQMHIAFAGNETALNEAYKRWEELEKQGNYREAIPYAEQAVRMEKEFDPNSKYVGEALNYLGVLYQRVGNKMSIYWSMRIKTNGKFHLVRLILLPDDG